MPIEGGIVLDFTFMKSVLKIDDENMMCLVEPGIVCAELNAILAKRGFFLPPVPASSEMATIGGCVANNAAGYRTVKYGSFKNWILGLETVLPSGKVIWTGSKTRKTSSGYDLTRLLVGSEGTLGIFTKIRLRIHPLPECRRLLIAYYNDIENACKTVIDLMSSNILPSAVEIMDKLSIEAVIKYGIELQKCESIVIVELDGTENDVRQRMKVVKKISVEHNAFNTHIGISKEEIKDLWKGRKSITPALVAIKPNIIDEDIAVPVTQVVELFKRIKGISDELGLSIATYGHIGDGNLHPDILFDKRRPEEVDKAIKAVEKLREIVIELGGTLTGEHGIGIRRMKVLKMEHQEEEIEVMRLIKNTLDPKNIMNPAKMI